MRLGDLDALIVEVDESIFNLAFTSPYQDEIERVRDGMERVRDYIESTPTIDPEALRPKGEWIRPTKINGRSFDIPHCSVCEGVPCGVDENTRYCPHCGAKMENKPCE